MTSDPENTFDMGDTYDRNRYPMSGGNQRQPSTHQSAVSRSLQDFDVNATAREGKMGETTTASSSEQHRRVSSSSISWSIPVDATAGDPPGLSPIYYP